MNEYVLVLILYWTNPAITNIDHLTKAQCEFMGNAFVKDAPKFYAKFMCLERNGK